jgi:hypothetical protein
MKTGSKSILFGIHNPIIHYMFMLSAWVKLYWGDKEKLTDLLDSRLHLCFLLHDIGYWGCEEMDGESGSNHPYMGANIVRKMFGDKWGNFCLFHSGTTVQTEQANYMMSGYGHRPEPSDLYAVDKLASALYPPWLYKLLSRWSGEWKEYAGIHIGAKREVNDRQGIDGTIVYELFMGGYKTVTFEEWHTPAMELIRKRAYEFRDQKTWRTMHQAVKEARDG